MIESRHVIKFSIPEMVMPSLYEHANMKCLSYRSKIRKEEDYTPEMLIRDNLLGVIGTYAGIWHLTGSNLLYYKHMEETGDKLVGDGGTDVPGARMDFKTSLWNGSLPLSKNRLAVRPGEFHPKTTYVLVMVDGYGRMGADGYIVGCMESWEILEKYHHHEKFGDAYCVKALLLNPFPNLHWGEME